MRNERNFFFSTHAVFKGSKRPKRNPDYISYDMYGGISSEYWYTPRGVYRCSDHWSTFSVPEGKKLRAIQCGRVASCYWTLKNSSPIKGYEQKPTGFCSWKDFN